MSPVPLNAVAHGPEDGPVVVLGPSLGTTAAMWEPQAGPLADAGVRVLAYDHRGHGSSPVPPGPYELEDLGRDVLALLDDRGIERAAVGGVSLGGMVAMWLAAHAPERVERLVVCASSPHFPPASLWQDRARAVLEAGSTTAIADGVVRNWLTPEYAALHPQDQGWLRAQLESIDPGGYAACCAAIETMDLRPDLGSIRAPALVIAGRDDPSTPPADHARLIADGISGARYEELAPAAHLLNVEQRDRVTELIRDHVLGR